MNETLNNAETPPCFIHGVSGSASLKLKHIVIIGKFDDGKCRQVLIKPKTQDVVLSAVIACEQQIRVLETIIEGIDIELSS